jgi:hypothetical protein
VAYDVGVCLAGYAVHAARQHHKQMQGALRFGIIRWVVHWFLKDITTFNI